MQTVDRQGIVRELAQQVRQLETAGRAQHRLGSISSGIEAVDRQLPAAGYVAGSLVEFLRERSSSGAVLLALWAARQAMDGGKYLLIVDRQRRFYAPALLGLELPLDRVIVVQPPNDADAIWSIDQGLRSPGVGAVLAEMDRMDDRVARRLQLAAERGGGLGLLIRKVQAVSSSQTNWRGQFHSANIPSWAEVQWHVRPKAWSPAAPVRTNQSPSENDHQHALGALPDEHANRRWLELHLLRCRGGRAGARLSLVLDGDLGGKLRVIEDRPQSVRTEGVRHASEGALCLAAQLAMPTRAAERSQPGRPGVRASSA